MHGVLGKEKTMIPPLKYNIAHDQDDGEDDCAVSVRGDYRLPEAKLFTLGNSVHYHGRHLRSGC